MPLVFDYDTVGDLTTGQISYWPYEETSGNRSDLVGSNTLVDNNTVTGGTGKKGNSAQFTRANNEWFSVADNDTLSPSGSFTFDTWVYKDSEPSGGILGFAGKANAAGTQREFWFGYRQSTDRFEVSFYNTAAPALSVDIEATTFGATSTATWYYVCIKWDQAAHAGYIGVNGGTFDTASNALVSVGNSTADFTIGRRFNDETGVNHDGMQDETGFWGRLLSDQNVTDRFNSGNGNTMVDATGHPTMRRWGGVKHMTPGIPATGRTW